MSGSEITTRHMFFSLIVSPLSATGHDALSALCFVQPNYDECRLPLGMDFGFYASSRPTIMCAKHSSE